jgi:hypothetical protein
MRAKEETVDDLKKLRETLDTLQFIMARCTSDSAYRVYADRERKLIDQINALERQRAGGDGR